LAQIIDGALVLLFAAGLMFLWWRGPAEADEEPGALAGEPAEAEAEAEAPSDSVEAEEPTTVPVEPEPAVPPEEAHVEPASPEPESTAGPSPGA
jgi:hypothetical protein